MNTCTRRTEFAKKSTVALALWVSIAFPQIKKNSEEGISLPEGRL